MSAVDVQHPWLGLASFTEETRGFFHGREEEVAELGRRVQRKLLTILFGQSGLGKTSILRAGIVPRLRPEGYCPVYVRIDYSPESPPPSEQIKQAIFRATESTGTWTQPGAAVAGESLWEFLHHRDDILRDASGRTIVPLLIFDQFEEIFTLAQGDDAGRKRAAEFVADLADLVENRPPRELEARLDADDSITERFDFSRADYRILIALREDYLAHLESFKGAMPSITQNRMRLARMTGQQALSAVMKPGGRLVSQEVAEAIVRFIAGGSELPNAEVEPSLLSLICRELNNARIAQVRSEISADLLAGSHDTILNEFYERALVDQPVAVRRFIEDEMLTESGFRESLAEERVLKAFAAAGAAPDTLATLVNRRLLRIEERLDIRRVELTHDVLCPVVQASRDVRHEREARDEAERQLAAQKAREEATRKALRRARKIAAACAVLAIGAVVSAVFGWQNMKRAQQAEAKAQQTRQMAESARGESEKLLVYLLDDFARELEPIGRLDIVSSLTQRALDYYRELPPELRTPDTERNRALALVRFGAVARREGNLENGMSALKEAEDVFRRLRSQGDSTETTVLGHALALHYQGAILVTQLKRPEAIEKGEAALAELQPLVAGKQQVSTAVLRAQGEILVGLGYLHQADDELQKAVTDLEDAQRVYRQLGAPGLEDVSAAAQYSYAGTWLAGSLYGLERWDESKAKHEETLEVANRVLDAMPGHSTALNAKALSLGRLAEMETFDLRIAKALALSREDELLYEGIVKTSSTNAGSWNNLGVARTFTANALWEAGRLAECRDKIRAAIEVGERMPKIGSFQAQNLTYWSGWVAEVEADLGNPAAAAAALAESERVWQRYVKPTAAPFNVAFDANWIEVTRAWILLGNGEWPRAASHAAAVLERIDDLKPKTKAEEDAKRRQRLRSNLAIAVAELERGNPAASEAAVRKVLVDWKPLPRRDFLGTERDLANFETLLAEAVARQGRTSEARDTLRSALKYHRDRYARRHDAPMQHFELARAIYVSALAEPDRRGALLAEASAILDSLPPTMSQWQTAVRLRKSIAETARVKP